MPRLLVASHVSVDSTWLYFLAVAASGWVSVYRDLCSLGSGAQEQHSIQCEDDLLGAIKLSRRGPRSLSASEPLLFNQEVAIVLVCACLIHLATATLHPNRPDSTRRHRHNMAILAHTTHNSASTSTYRPISAHDILGKQLLQVQPT